MSGHQCLTTRVLARDSLKTAERASGLFHLHRCQAMVQRCGASANASHQHEYTNGIACAEILDKSALAIGYRRTVAGVVPR